MENRTGANGNIGTEAAAKSAPDGYTILVAPDSVASNPHVYKVNYELKDLTPVIQLSRQPIVLAAHPTLGVKTIAELIAHAKKHPGERFATGSGMGFRAAMRIPRGAFLVGHIGRLAPEKNLGFLARAVATFLKRNAAAHALVVGSGPSDPEIRRIFRRAGVEERLHLAGTLKDLLLISAYAAMEGADALAILTEWNEFRAVDLERVKALLKTPIVIDLRNVYEPAAMAAAGFQYSSIGRPYRGEESGQ